MAWQHRRPGRGAATVVLLAAAGVLGACGSAAPPSGGSQTPDPGEPGEVEPLDLVDEHRIDEPTTVLTLPDGVEVELVGMGTTEVADVEVTPVQAPGTSDGSWQVEVHNRRDAPVFVPTFEPAEAGPVLALRTVDLRYERGEVDYVRAPTDEAVRIDAGDAHTFDERVATDEGAPPTVCVEVVDEAQLDHGEPATTGDLGHVHIRHSSEIIEVACHAGGDA